MLQIRQGNAADTGQISALITSLAHLFLASPDGNGAEMFKEAITPEALALFIVRPDVNYLVGEVGGEFCGAVAVFEHRHLRHLFVAPKFQGRGIGGQLWRAARDAAMAAGNPGEFTVNASLNAVPVYQRFGFEWVGGPQQNNGLVFQPMKLVRAKDEPPTASDELLQ
jgi:GNAT superfamily N-acetyltransferase